MNYDDRPWLAHYDVGVPESIDVPEISLVDLLAQSVERFGSKTCIIQDGNEWTYDDVERASNQFAHALLAQGLQKGERVGLFSAQYSSVRNWILWHFEGRRGGHGIEPCLHAF